MWVVRTLNAGCWRRESRVARQAGMMGTSADHAQSFLAYYFPKISDREQQNQWIFFSVGVRFSPLIQTNHEIRSKKSYSCQGFTSEYNFSDFTYKRERDLT